MMFLFQFISIGGVGGLIWDSVTRYLERVSEPHDLVRITASTVLWVFGTHAALKTMRSKFSDRDIPRSTYPKDLPDTFGQVPSDPSHTDGDHSHLRSCAENPRQEESSPSADCLAQTDFQVSQLQDSEAQPSQDPKEEVDPVKEVQLGSGSFDHIDGSQETKQQTHDSVAEEEEEEEKMAAVLFGYDAQWCWIESQDDVTFL